MDSVITPPTRVPGEAGLRVVDWREITGGSAIYTSDVRLPGLLHGAAVRSPHPRARIVSIDVSAAAALDGVIAVLTSEDISDRMYLDYGEYYSDRTVLARGVVRHVGELVALVAATDDVTARAAAALVKVRYRRDRAVDTVADARARRAPRVHPNGNTASSLDLTFGAMAEARSATVRSVRASYRSSTQSHACMEPHTVVAWWKTEEQRLEIWAPSQGPRAIQHDLCHVFDLAPEQVHLNEVAVGGDFGSRVDSSHLEGAAAALSIHCGRPVRFAHTRAEDFAFTKSRHEWDLDLELGVDAEGLVTFLDASCLVDNGAYNMAGPSETEYGSIALGSTYRLTGYHVTSECTYTNKQPPSSFRGAGGYPVNYGIECIADEVADALQVDPIDFRLRNALSQVGETSVTGWSIKSSRLAECLVAVREEIDWDAKRRSGGQGRGIGVACTMHVTGVKREGMVESGAALDFLANGTIRLRSGCGDPGTGQKSMLAGIVAAEFGVPLTSIEVVSTDTDRTPHDTGAGASRGTLISGHAVRTTCAVAHQALRAIAAEKLATSSDDVSISNGSVRAGQDRIPIADLVGFAADGADALTFEAEYVGEHEPHPEDGYGDISATYSFAVHAVEVEVDQETGQVKVLQVVAAHDSGRLLNPNGARGQVEGGVVMGLGAALGEELIREGGRVVNHSYIDYALPRLGDVPPVKVIFLGADDPIGPYGAKGLGEIALLPTASAVANAVSHAIGARVRRLPITPDRVLTALRERDCEADPEYSVRFRPRRWWVAGIRWAYPRGLHHLLHRFGTRFARRIVPTDILQVERPATVSDAVGVLAADLGARPLGGATDLLVARDQGLLAPTTLVDLTGCRDITTIEEQAGGELVIGAAVRLADLERHPSTRRLPMLRDALASIASPQLRESATVGGNLCQAKRCWFFRNGFECYKRSGPLSPCYAVLGDHRFFHNAMDAHRCQAVTPSDLGAVFIALDATIDIVGQSRNRSVHAGAFYTGPGEVDLAHDEVVSSVRIPGAVRAQRTSYRKLTLTDGGFAVVSAAVRLGFSAEGVVDDACVVVGGIAATPYRAGAAERVLIGTTPTADSLITASRSWITQAHPLENNGWKLDAAAGVVRKALADVLEPGTGGPG